MGTQGRRETITDISYYTETVCYLSSNVTQIMGINLAVKKTILSFHTLFSLLKQGDLVFMGTMFNVCTLREATLEQK